MFQEEQRAAGVYLQWGFWCKSICPPLHPYDWDEDYGHWTQHTGQGCWRDREKLFQSWSGNIPEGVSNQKTFKRCQKVVLEKAWARFFLMFDIVYIRNLSIRSSSLIAIWNLRVFKSTAHKPIACSVFVSFDSVGFHANEARKRPQSRNDWRYNLNT